MNLCATLGKATAPPFPAIRRHPWYVTHAPPCRRIRLRWRRARRTLRGLNRLLLVAQAGVLVGRRSLVLVAGRVGVGVGVGRPRGAHCRSLRRTFLGWTRRRRRTWFCLVQARYFAPNIMEQNVAFMDEKCVVLLFYGSECLVYGRDCLFYGRECLVYGRDGLVYGRECLIYGRDGLVYGRDCLVYGRDCLGYGPKMLIYG